jgi:primosomal protein N'
MYLITILPLSHNPQTDELSYFSKVPYETGAFVIAPLGKQKLTGLVLKSTSLLEEKQTIKDAPFEMRKLPEQEPLFVLPFVDVYQIMAEYHLVTLNFLLRHALPYEYLLKETISEKTSLTKKNKIEALQAKESERVTQYKSLVRSTFSKQQSVIIVVPTVQEIHFWYDSIKKGIESVTIKITSEQTAKVREESLKTIQSSEHPLLIITTPYYFPIVSYKKHVLILEHESSPYYRDHISKLHMEAITIALAEKVSERILRGDTLLSTETLYLLKKGIYDTYIQLQWPEKEVKTTVVARPKDRDYELFSVELQTLLKKVISEQKKVVLYGVRNGLATLTKCQTCQATLCCDTCSIPLVLVTRPEGRVFRCSKCHTTYEATKPCQQCGSRYLLPFGAGTETIETEIKTKFPELTTYRIDSEVTKTKKQAEKIIKQFEKETSGCLIVGEKGLRMVSEPTSYSAVVSCDSLFELPLLDAERKVFDILIALEKYTTAEMLIQVFDIEQSTIQAYQTGNIKKWSESHLAERTHFNYPPVYTHIKYTIALPHETQTQQIENMWKNLPLGNPQTNIMYHRSKGNYIFIGSIFVEREVWENDSTKKTQLQTALRSFPKSGRYEINPESLL